MRILPFLLLLAFFSGCTKPAELEIPELEAMLILDAKLYQGDSTIVYIDASYSAYGGGNRGMLDSNSRVLLYEDGVFVEQIDRVGRSGSRVFKTYYPTLVNKTYTLEVSNPNLGSARGSTFISNRTAEITQAELIRGENSSEVRFTLKDEGSQRDAYLIYVKVDSVQYIERLVLRASDPSLRTFAYAGIGSFDQERKSGGEFYLNDDTFNGDEKEFRLLMEEWSWNPATNPQAPIELVVMRIEPIWFDHKKSMFDQDISFLGIFSEPARVVQNVEGGYGIVRSATTAKFKLQ